MGSFNYKGPYYKAKIKREAENSVHDHEFVWLADIRIRSLYIIHVYHFSHLVSKQYIQQIVCFFPQWYIMLQKLIQKIIQYLSEDNLICLTTTKEGKEKPIRLQNSALPHDKESSI